MGDFDTETQMCELFVEWLKQDQEAPDPWFEVGLPKKYEVKSIADIVFEKEDILSVIHAKLHFNFRLLAQASDWLGFAHRIFTLAPEISYQTENRRKLLGLCERKGIGVFFISRGGAVRSASPGSIWATATAEPLRTALETSSRDYAKPGSPTGSRSTPWTNMYAAISQFVADVEPTNAAEVVRSVPETSLYGTRGQAISRILRDAKAKKIKGVRVELSGGRWCFRSSA